jgi:hypothetical protein
MNNSATPLEGCIFLGGREQAMWWARLYKVAVSFVYDECDVVFVS